VVFQPEEAQLSALHCHLELDMILSPAIIDLFSCWFPIIAYLILLAE
jgi:hypothetical protein